MPSRRHSSQSTQSADSFAVLEISGVDARTVSGGVGAGRNHTTVYEGDRLERSDYGDLPFDGPGDHGSHDATDQPPEGRDVPSHGDFPQLHGDASEDMRSPSEIDAGGHDNDENVVAPVDLADDAAPHQEAADTDAHVTGNDNVHDELGTTRDASDDDIHADATHDAGHDDDSAASSHEASHQSTDPGTTELGATGHDGVVSVESDDSGHTLTHFADGSSVTTDPDGNVVAFTEPHHDAPTENDHAHGASTDPHMADPGHHANATGQADPAHPPDASAVSSPPSLTQNPNVGDCFVVSTLNEIAARPGGMEYLRSLVTDRGDGIYEVTLQGPNGPETVLVQNNGTGASTPGPNQADNVVLQVLEQGIGASRSEGYGGNRPDDGLQSVTLGGTADSVFTQLGLTDVQSNGTMQDILKDQDRVPVDVNTVLDHIAAGDPVTLGTFSDGWRLFDLTPNHEYSIGAVITDELGFRRSSSTTWMAPIRSLLHHYLNDAGRPGARSWRHRNGTPTTSDGPWSRHRLNALDHGHR
ncbi:MAG: hypothetical protein U0235_32600 [Polyangiaceae bacterium]